MSNHSKSHQVSQGNQSNQTQQSTDKTGDKAADKNVDKQQTDASESRVAAKPEDDKTDLKADAKSDMKPEAKSDAKTEAKSDVKTAPSSQVSDKKQQLQTQPREGGGLGSINLSEILPDFSGEDVTRIGERISTYAEEKPLQTVGWAVAGGALVGWLLISKQGQSILRAGVSIAAPLVGSVLSGRQSISQVAENAASTLKH